MDASLVLEFRGFCTVASSVNGCGWLRISIQATILPPSPKYHNFSSVPRCFLLPSPPPVPARDAPLLEPVPGLGTPPRTVNSPDQTWDFPKIGGAPNVVP